MTLAVKLCFAGALFGLGAATPYALDAMREHFDTRHREEPVVSGTPPSREVNASTASASRPPEPTPPYLLDLGADSATICWITTEPTIGELELLAYDEVRTVRADGEPTRFHRIHIDGLHHGTTYRYRVGHNHTGEFTTANDGPVFECAVFGHPGGTEDPREFPTELLPARLEDIAPDFALCTGDIVNHATLHEFQHEFFHRFGEFMRRRPIYVTAANHDGRWNGLDYETFRRVFPRDYGGDKGAYYTFDYKHARFFAFTYAMRDEADAAAQLAWLEAALDASDQEFNIVFLGGEDTAYYDKDGFFRTLSKHRVDLVLGGDGGGIKPDTIHGVPYYFAGDGGTTAYPFYYLRFYGYHFTVQSQFSGGSLTYKPSHFGAIYSRREHPIVADLNDKHLGSTDTVLRYGPIDLPSTSFDGLSLTVDWTYPVDADIQVKWTRMEHRTGTVRLQYHRLRANSKNVLRFDLPRLSPIARVEAPYRLGDLIVQLVPYKIDAAKYPLRDKVLDAHLFAD